MCTTFSSVGGFTSSGKPTFAGVSSKGFFSSNGLAPRGLAGTKGVLFFYTSTELDSVGFLKGVIPLKGWAFITGT